MNNYNAKRRWDAMLGINSSTDLQMCRLAVLAFALFTMSNPSASYYIAPHVWAIGFLLWYWYPT